jgi:hypothetical protein
MMTTSLSLLASGGSSTTQQQQQQVQGREVQAKVGGVAGVEAEEEGQGSRAGQLLVEVEVAVLAVDAAGTE